MWERDTIIDAWVHTIRLDSDESGTATNQSLNGVLVRVQERSELVGVNHRGFVWFDAPTANDIGILPDNYAELYKQEGAVQSYLNTKLKDKKRHFKIRSGIEYDLKKEERANREKLERPVNESADNFKSLIGGSRADEIRKQMISMIDFCEKMIGVDSELMILMVGDLIQKFSGHEFTTIIHKEVDGHSDDPHTQNIRSFNAGLDIFYDFTEQLFRMYGLELKLDRLYLLAHKDKLTTEFRAVRSDSAWPESLYNCVIGINYLGYHINGFHEGRHYDSTKPSSVNILVK